MKIFVIYEEEQNQHGYVDTSILCAVTTEAEAEARVRAYENDGLGDGERVEGRAEEWNDPNYLVDEDDVCDADWTSSYSYTEIELHEGKQAHDPVPDWVAPDVFATEKGTT